MSDIDFSNCPDDMLHIADAIVNTVAESGIGGAIEDIEVCDGGVKFVFDMVAGIELLQIEFNPENGVIATVAYTSAESRICSEGEVAVFFKDPITLEQLGLVVLPVDLSAIA